MPRLPVPRSGPAYKGQRDHKDVSSMCCCHTPQTFLGEGTQSLHNVCPQNQIWVESLCSFYKILWLCRSHDVLFSMLIMFFIFLANSKACLVPALHLLSDHHYAEQQPRSSNCFYHALLLAASPRKLHFHIEQNMFAAFSKPRTAGSSIGVQLRSSEIEGEWNTIGENCRPRCSSLCLICGFADLWCSLCLVVFCSIEEKKILALYMRLENGGMQHEHKGSNT